MEISAVLFGAGQGKRLRPLTQALPKPALPLLDVPLGAWGLAALVSVAPMVVVNGSHLAGRLFEALEGLGLEGWESMTESPEAYGTAGTLSALRGRAGPRVTTWNGDLLSSLAPEALHRSHERLGRLATIAAVPVDAGADVILEGERVTAFVDRRTHPHVAGARFIGAAVFERSALERLPSTRPAGLGETLLRDLAESGDLGAHLFDGYWNDVGTPEAYRRASLDLLYERAPRSPVALPGDVVEVSGARAYIGPGAQAGAAELGAGAIVLRGARVEEGASIVEALVMPNETVPAGASVERTIWFGGRALPQI